MSGSYEIIYMANSITTIYTELENILKSDVNLASYIKAYYEGYREDIPEGNFPCIMLDPVEESEKIVSYPNFPELTIDIDIYCVLNVMDMDKQIIGDGTNKGIFDIIADVKNCLAGYLPSNGQALNGTCNKFSMSRVNYLFWNYNNYSFRGGVLRFQAVKETTPNGR